jgi:hypothetical protein
LPPFFVQVQSLLLLVFASFPLGSSALACLGFEWMKVASGIIPFLSSVQEHQAVCASSPYLLFFPIIDNPLAE